MRVRRAVDSILPHGGTAACFLKPTLQALDEARSSGR